MAQVNVTITGSAPVFSVNPSGGTYPPPLTEMFTNSSTTDDCKLWYQSEGQTGVHTTVLAKNGGNLSLTGGVSFNVTAANSDVKPTMSHVIHVGSGVE